jgi:hypothetical protein
MGFEWFDCGAERAVFAQVAFWKSLRVAIGPDTARKGILVVVLGIDAGEYPPFDKVDSLW